MNFVTFVTFNLDFLTFNLDLKTFLKSGKNQSPKIIKLRLALEYKNSYNYKEPVKEVMNTTDLNKLRGLTASSMITLGIAAGSSI